MDFKQGDFENIIMNAVWDLEDSGIQGIDVTEVQTGINCDQYERAYTTVKTVLDRLVKKDMLERLKCNKKFCYRSKISRKEAGINAIEKISRQYFQGEIKELAKTAEKICAEALAYR